MKPTLYLIRGLPGSGKSTFAWQLYEKRFVFDVLEADQYFKNSETGEYKFDASQLKYAHLDCQYRAKCHLQVGNDIAVSNTSTTEAEVETYRKIAEDAGANFVSIVVENRHGGKNVHNVPDEHIAKMRNRFTVKL